MREDVGFLLFSRFNLHCCVKVKEADGEMGDETPRSFRKVLFF